MEGYIVADIPPANTRINTPIHRDTHSAITNEDVNIQATPTDSGSVLAGTDDAGVDIYTTPVSDSVDIHNLTINDGSVHVTTTDSGVDAHATTTSGGSVAHTNTTGDAYVAITSDNVDTRTSDTKHASDAHTATTSDSVNDHTATIYYGSVDPYTGRINDDADGQGAVTCDAVDILSKRIKLASQTFIWRIGAHVLDEFTRASKKIQYEKLLQEEKNKPDAEGKNTHC